MGERHKREQIVLYKKGGIRDRTGRTITTDRIRKRQDCHDDQRNWKTVREGRELQNKDKSAIGQDMQYRKGRAIGNEEQ